MQDDSFRRDDAIDANFQYMTGQMNASQPALLAAYEEESAAALGLRPALDLRYGPHPRQTFDLFEAAEPIGTVAYLHAGYWQSRDKAQFRFLAPSFLEAGLNVAVVNYPLCPDVTLAALTDAVRDSIAAIAKMAPSSAHAGLVAMGHSAGAHLCVELALTDWQARGFSRSPLRGIVALSGVYDLAPLIMTPLNDKLRLDPSSAKTASPINRVRTGMPPALFAVGGLETPAFRRQTADMLEAWRNAGNRGEALIAEDRDHFSLLRSAQDPGGALFEKMMALF